MLLFRPQELTKTLLALRRAHWHPGEGLLAALADELELKLDGFTSRDMAAVLGAVERLGMGVSDDLLTGMAIIAAPHMTLRAEEGVGGAAGAGERDGSVAGAAPNEFDDGFLDDEAAGYYLESRM